MKTHSSTRSCHPRGRCILPLPQGTVAAQWSGLTGPRPGTPRTLNINFCFSPKTKNTPMKLSQINLLCLLFPTRPSVHFYLDCITTLHVPERGAFHTFFNVCAPSTSKLLGHRLQYFFDTLTANYPAMWYSPILSVIFVQFLKNNQNGRRIAALLHHKAHRETK